MHITFARAVPRLLTAVAGGILLCSLGGCSDDSREETNADTATLEGVAAYGAPVVDGTVVARCADGSGFTTAVTTNAQGTFNAQVTASAPPCVLKVSGGNLPAGYGALHSLATSAGTTNLTPLTDLALALSVNAATGQSLTQWVQGTANLDAVAAGLGTALDTLRTGLIGAGFTLPASWTAGSSAPVTAVFTPDPATDAYDALLEALAEAIAASAAHADYAALRTAFTAGGTLPSPPEPTPTVGLRFRIDSIEARRVTITVSGTLAGSDPTYDRNALYLHAAGNWIEYAVDSMSDHVTGSATGSPVADKDVVGVTAYDMEQNSLQMKSFGDYIRITFAAPDLRAGNDGSSTQFSFEFPKDVIRTSELGSLSLSWGTTGSKFGPLQHTVAAP